MGGHPVLPLSLSLSLFLSLSPPSGGLAGGRAGGWLTQTKTASKRNTIMKPVGSEMVIKARGKEVPKRGCLAPPLQNGWKYKPQPSGGIGEWEGHWKRTKKVAG